MSEVNRNWRGKGGMGFLEEHHGEDEKGERRGTKRRFGEQAGRLEDKI